LFRTGSPSQMFLGVMRMVVSGEGSADADGALFEAASSAQGITPRTAALAARMFGLRLQGRPVEAREVSALLSGQTGSLRPVFDSTGGWAVCSGVQGGTTAMFAGDFTAAHLRFTQARMHAIVPRV